MSQKGKQGRHGNAIGEMAALRWEPTHVTKHCPRVVLLQRLRLKDVMRYRGVVERLERSGREVR